MVKRAVFVSFILITLLLPLALFASESSEQDFEAIDWTLPFPDVILQNTGASIDLGPGFFYNPAGKDSFIGLYMQFRPRLHFLVFDGTFNVGIRTFYQDQDVFLDLANERTEDYYEDIRVKIKRFSILYAESAESSGEYLYHPYTSPVEKNLKIQWENNNWHVSALTSDWKQWSLDFETPEIGWDSLGFGADIQGFYESTPTNSFAVSAGPKIRFYFLDAVPFVGLKYTGVPEDTEGTPSTRFTWGLKTVFRYNPISVKASIQWTSIPEYTLAIGFGPLAFSFGKRAGMGYGADQEETWQQIAWQYTKKGIETKIGFGSVNQSFYIFSDIDIGITDQWSIRASVKSGMDNILPLATPSLGLEGLCFSVGVEYSIPIRMDEQE
jgi:hypothetical protein